MAKRKQTLCIQGYTIHRKSQGDFAGMFIEEVPLWEGVWIL